MTVFGPDFLALQVADLDRAAAFYDHLGLRRATHSPPGAVVFDTGVVSFAVREPMPGVDLAQAQPRPGFGVALWMGADNTQALHDQLAGEGVTIIAPPTDGPFGRMFTFTDPDGYAITVHDQP